MLAKHMMDETQRISLLAEALKHATSLRERLDILDRDPRIKHRLAKPSWLKTFLAHLNEECEFVIKSLIALGQEEKLLSKEFNQGDTEKLRELLEDLFPVEIFYKEMGGLIGYHWTMLSFLKQKDIFSTGSVDYHRPPGIDIRLENERVRRYILQGIISLPLMGEIYPVGGAADRLNFCDSKSGQPLPAAKLAFNGITLLEGLIRDVQAREYLYFKLFKIQVTTPLAMMTSLEKDNHHQVLSICEEGCWFGRPKESFRFFSQPLVPTMDKEGNWCWKGTLKLLMKPGGHGVLWKVAKDKGIFDWLEALGRKKILIRQINNPVAGVDYGILAFCGVGIEENKGFGFASCPRQVGSAEGVDILVERKFSTYHTYCLTNIEYCDFQKFGIEDVPVTLGSSYSQFPSNTNILFADIATIKEAITKCPLPGMIVNLKKIAFTDDHGNHLEQEVVRLESTMQNIADCFEVVTPSSLSLDDIVLKTYLTYNHRHKTISAAKKMFHPSASLLETPEGCFYDQLRNAYDLLHDHCQVVLPPFPDLVTYMDQGPPFMFFYHPALGPLYSIIAQKIRGGQWTKHSELKLEITEIEMINLRLSGSLHIIADQVLGEKGEDGILRYSDNVGRCRLINVIVENQGYDPQATSPFWNLAPECRRELCEIIIHGNAEFYAENVILHGGMKIEVDPGMRLIAYEDQGILKFKTEPLSASTPNWIYHLLEDHSIRIQWG